MCETVPFFRKYCGFISLQLGLLFISIQSIVTGVLGLSIIEVQTNMDYTQAKNFTELLRSTGANHVLTNLDTSITYGFTLIFFVYIFLGVILLIATFWDNESLLLTFVWGTFLNVAFGYSILGGLAIVCIMEDTCLFSSMDWISASLVFILMVLFFTLWLYYGFVAHSYVEDKKNFTEDNNN
ncbi:uncharacterized protein LOC106716839 [Papilio machaon]|uniref:uncharacterized protein LOC106716839 n=1 Tax=Papilio machaon TaxID=76193 RepID=UPI001E665417|nr:uncharacterized protein LOC106716839 [Papilio machaon]